MKRYRTESWTRIRASNLAERAMATYPLFLGLGSLSL